MLSWTPVACRAACPDAGLPFGSGHYANATSAFVSRRKRRASGLLPQLASSAVPEVEAPLPADPHASPSGEQTCHPEIRVRRDAPVVRPCRFVERSPFWSLLFSSQRDGTTHISPPRKRRAPFREECRPPLSNPQVWQTHMYRC